MSRIFNIIIAIALCFGVGFTAHWFQSESIDSWYPMLVKSSLTPPDAAFPIAWAIIYLCMGLSIGLVWGKSWARKLKLTTLFVVQLMLNFLWSISFFYLQSPLLGLVNIILLDIVVLWYTVSAFYVRRISAWLFLPYILWLVLATYLNAYIIIHN